MSEQTKKYKDKRNIFRLISFLCSILPIIIYSVIALVNGTPMQKVAMSTCLFIVLIFVVINVIFKHRIRCTIWILLLGIYFAVDNIIPLIIIMACTTALDEFIFEPLSKSYANKYTINKEIDKRNG